MCTSVLCVSNVQESTPRCDRHHRLHFLSSEFLHLEVKTPLSGETGWNLVLIWGRLWFLTFLWPNLTQPSKKVHWPTPFRRTSIGVDENVRVFTAD